jgi:tetratricopeptide (TPR) repeat protein
MFLHISERLLHCAASSFHARKSIGRFLAYRILKRSAQILMLVLLMTSAPGNAYETLTTVFVDGSAPIVMDGSLDDWVNIPAQEVPVTNPFENAITSTKVFSDNETGEYPFSFKCFADKDFVYFALIMKDDKVILERHGFGYGPLEDSAALFFDGDCLDTSKRYYDSNDGMLRVAGSPLSGSNYIEGLVPYFYPVQIPFFWEARGVKSGFGITMNGYVTELALPASLLGWDSINAGKQMGANVTVLDLDRHSDEEKPDNGFIWAPDPLHTIYYSTSSFNRIVFSKVIPANGLSLKEKKVEKTSDGENGIAGALDFAGGDTLFNSVLADLEKEDFDSAEARLLPEQDKIWVKPILGVIQLKKYDYNGAIQLLDFGDECPYPWGDEFVRDFLKHNLNGLLVNYKGTRNNSRQKIFQTYGNVSKVYAEHYPTDLEGLFNYAEYLGNISLSKRAQEVYRTIIQTGQSSPIKDQDVFTSFQYVARSYLALGEYAQADTVLKELVTMFPEKTTNEEFAKYLSSALDHVAAIQIYEKIVETSSSESQKHDARFEIMMQYFSMHDTEKFIEYVKAHPDLQERVETKTILKVIEDQKKNMGIQQNKNQ